MAAAALGRYEVCSSSERMPELDFAVLARYAVRNDTPGALWEFEAGYEREPTACSYVTR